MTDRDRLKLLFGPYQAPPLKRGDRTHCLFRDGLVVVTGWTNAPIPWPRCRALDSPGGGSGLLVDEELARAVRHESAAAVMFWWGSSMGAVCRWRKALGVTRTGNEGTAHLVQVASELGAAELRGKELPPEQVKRRRRTAEELGWGETSSPASTAPGGPLRTSPYSARCPMRKLPGGRAAARTRCA
jgi:hypothetical protein